MKAHTPEPIRHDDYGKIFYANGDCEAFVTDVHFARRIVACVNACAGISTDDLERCYNTGGGIDEAMDEASLRAHATAEKQRDELLAALKPFGATDLASPGLPAEFAMLVLRARAVIASTGA